MESCVPSPQPCQHRGARRLCSDQSLKRTKARACPKVRATAKCEHTQAMPAKCKHTSYYGYIPTAHNRNAVNAFVSQVVSCAHSPAQGPSGDGPATVCMLRVAHARQLRQRSTTAALLSKPTDHPFSTMVLYACAMCVRHQLDSGPTVCGVHVQCV